MTSVRFPQRLFIVTGKGGVGKSTVAAALGLRLSRAGEKVLVCEVGGPNRLSALYGVPVGKDVTEVAPRLFAVNVDPEAALHEYGLMVLKYERLYRAVFGNRVVRYFLKFVPSLQELVLLGKILFHVRETAADGSFRFDRVIIDAPATGHAISFFSLPQVLVDTVPPGPLSADATWMRDLLVDSATTGVILVTLPEELPVTETLELHASLNNKVKLSSVAVVLNQTRSSRLSDEALRDPAWEAHSALHGLVKNHERLAHATGVSTARLKSLGLPVLWLPHVTATGTATALVTAMAEHLPFEAPRP